MTGQRQPLAVKIAQIIQDEVYFDAASAVISTDTLSRIIRLIRRST
jgi:hypothetical protein